MFVYQGRPDQSPLFFDRLDPEATAIADPDGDLFAAFEIRRGGWREMFGLRAWVAGIRATLKGNLINRKIGDPWTLPTVLVASGGRVVAEFIGEHAGDHPDVATLVEQLDELGIGVGS
ncbi:MAG: hypothetical protein AAGD33_14810 [Actinomycetota bacterium]